MPRKETISTLGSVAPAILPSLLLCDFARLETEVHRLEDAGVAALHLDVMDGVFVPNFTYGLTIVEALNKVTDLPLDVHLMMVNPDKYVRQFVDAGADVLTFHLEATEDPLRVLHLIQENDVAAGIAINPQTPAELIRESVAVADLALVMSVNAGFGGQAFHPEVLQKFEQIRKFPGGDKILLQIDGGISAKTIAEAVTGGAQLLVAGSAIFNHPDYAVAISQMMSQVNC